MRKVCSQKRNNNNNNTQSSSSNNDDPSMTTPTKGYNANGTVSTPTVSTPMQLRGSNAINSNKGGTASTNNAGYGYNVKRCEN